MILALKTDQPEAELYLLSEDKVLSSYHWHAHRQLSNTLLEKIEVLLKDSNQKLVALTGVIVYKGPGSFTGLRIGIATMNTLSYSLNIPIVGTTTEEWLAIGKKALLDTQDGSYVQPLYGSAPTITKPKK